VAGNRLASAPDRGSPAGIDADFPDLDLGLPGSRPGDPGLRDAQDAVIAMPIESRCSHGDLPRTPSSEPPVGADGQPAEHDYEADNPGS
jgi:hypothetical protein